MGLVRKLFSIIGFFVVVKLNAAVYSASYYECQYIPRLYDRTMAGAHLCLESQLTDSSRFKLRDILNEYRRNISMGLKSSSKHSNVFEIEYHWICEYFAVMVENENIPEGLLTGETIEVLSKHYFDDFIFSGRGPDAPPRPNKGSFDKIPFDDPSSETIEGDANYTIFNLALNESTQSESIDAFIAHIRQRTDLYLTTGKQRMMGPGTTFFGCSVRFFSNSSTVTVTSCRNTTSCSNGTSCQNTTSCLNETSCQNTTTCFNVTSPLWKLTCVFRTPPEADPDYQEGTMSYASCRKAEPQGTFVPDLNLCCDDQYSSDDSRRYDVPCQLFYNISMEKLPALMVTCNGEDLRTKEMFLVPPDGYSCAKISYDDIIPFTFGSDNYSSCYDGALNLHPVSIYLMVVLTTIIQKFCL